MDAGWSPPHPPAQCPRASVATGQADAVESSPQHGWVDCKMHSTAPIMAGRAQALWCDCSMRFLLTGKSCVPEGVAATIKTKCNIPSHPFFLIEDSFRIVASQQDPAKTAQYDDLHSNSRRRAGLHLRQPPAYHFPHQHIYLWWLHRVCSFTSCHMESHGLNTR